MTALSPPATALDAYEATAPVYDAFTRHHRHDPWTDMLETLLRPHGLPPRGELLDVGCGTGKSFLPWERRGWSVTACDASPAMLAHAAAKAGAGTTTLLADARDLPAIGRFDLVTLTDDVVNYLEPHELPAAFAGVARNLALAGLVAFDVNTLRTYRTFFAETAAQDEDDCVLVWRGAAAPDLAPGDAAEAVLDAFTPDGEGGWQRRTAVHRQHHHPAGRLSAALAAAGLRLRAVHGADDDCRTGPLDELRHDKAVLVASR